MSDRNKQDLTQEERADVELNFLLPDYYIPTGEQVTEFMKEEIREGAEETN